MLDDDRVRASDDHADNDNIAAEADPSSAIDVFTNDLDAWLAWLMDCVAIETKIRRRQAERATKLQGPSLQGPSGDVEPTAGGAPGPAGGGDVTGMGGGDSPAAVRDSTRPIGK